MKRAFISPNIQNHFTSKDGMNGEAMEYIDFDFFFHFIKKKQPHRKFRILKMFHGWLLTFSHKKDPSTIKSMLLRK